LHPCQGAIWMFAERAPSTFCSGLR
jgi:hypothetical protein